MLMPRRGMIASGGLSDPYVTQAAEFDGTNDNLTKASAYSTAASSKIGLLSFWAKKTGGDGSAKTLMGDTTTTTYVTEVNFTTANKLDINFQEPGGGAGGVRVISDNTWTVDGLWHHLAFSWDNAASKHQLYRDGVAWAHTVSYQTNANITWAARNPTIGVRNTSTNRFQGYLADFWFTMLEQADLSDSAVMAKLRDADGKPVNLGANGELVTGTSPVAFYHIDVGGAASDFATNLGDGGGMTEVGALTLAADSPTD